MTEKITQDYIIYYYYIVNGVEHFTSSEDLAFNRADEDTEVKIKKINKYT